MKKKHENETYFAVPRGDVQRERRRKRNFAEIGSEKEHEGTLQCDGPLRFQRVTNSINVGYLYPDTFLSEEGR